MTPEKAYEEWHMRLPVEGPAGDPLEAAFMAGWDAFAASVVKTYPAPAGVIPTMYEIHGMSDDHKASMIWKAWPIKKARGAAVPAITKALKKVRLAELLIAVDEYAAALKTWKPEDMKFVPMCSTWMNQERWLDDRKEWVRGTPVVSQFSKTR